MYVQVQSNATYVHAIAVTCSCVCWVDHVGSITSCIHHFMVLVLYLAYRPVCKKVLAKFLT